MTDIRRSILWVVFSASLFLIWDAWNKHNGQPSFFAPPPAKVAAPATLPASGGGLPKPTTAIAPVASTTPGAAPATTSTAAPTEAALTEISTDVVKATLSSTGGTLVRLELLKYPDHVVREWYEPLLEMFGRKSTPAPAKDVVLLDQTPERLYVAESGLVPAAGGSGLPNHHTAMTVLPGERTLAAGQKALTVQYESPVVGGVKLRRSYTFKRGDYVVDVRNEVVNESGAPVSPRLYLQLVRDGIAPPGESSFYFTFTGPAIDDGAKFQKVEFKDIEKRSAGAKPDHTTESDAGWVAMVQHYFASAWLIDKEGTKQPREYFTGKADTVNPATGQTARVYSVGMLVPLGEVAPGATKTFDAKLFVGPQEENKLAELAPRLELVKDYGIFKILAEPLFWLLTQLHKIFGNWGWSIVGLVVLLKIAFYWLNAKAYASMAKMKAINPKIMEMRERLKDKPQQMQQEMMRIYREEKVNPLGGCLPIVAQMPFFISLYWVLLSTVEMRGAPWIGWITDLSAKDPYFILPILMTLTSLLQTWLNPTPPDPVQARMMWIMPLIFSVMFFVFPAGLVLYWLTNNILSIAQQYVINKRLGVN
ncbi:MAG: membrane protein insertase YidC [Burkholderiales bacterium]|nr:membrane protein insertase YidC [Burkholderiales bacterium]